MEEVYITEEDYIAEFNHYRDIMADLLDCIDATDIDKNEWSDLAELLDDDIDEFGKEIKKISLKKKKNKEQEYEIEGLWRKKKRRKTSLF